MRKEEFQKIMEALELRQTLCARQLDEIHTTDDLSQLTLAQAADLKSFCVAEEEVMTKIAMVDLYHIIGMGELTPPQMMKFTFAIQKYLQYRPTVKAIAGKLDSITELPKIPVETQYKLQGLGDLTLKSNFSTAEVDRASVSDYTKIRAAKLPFRVTGSEIRVDITQLEYFATLMSNISKSSISINNFRKKLENHGEYLGIQWTGLTSYEAIGVFKSADMMTRLTGYYNKRI